MKNTSYISTFPRTISIFILIINLVNLHVPALAKAPSLYDFDCNAAGVLPIYTYKGKPYCLLSREAWGKPGTVGTYDSFAGGSNKGEDATTTAARECAEELIAHITIHKDAASMRSYINLNKNNTEAVLVDTRKKYVLFITRFDNAKHIQPIRQKFYPALKKSLESKYREKDKLALVPWSNLQQACKDNSLSVQALVQEYNAATQTVQSKWECIQLRPILLSMLKLHFNNNAYTRGRDKRIRFY